LIKHDHTGSLFLSFGGVGRLPKLRMTSVITKREMLTIKLYAHDEGGFN